MSLLFMKTILSASRRRIISKYKITLKLVHNCQANAHYVVVRVVSGEGGGAPCGDGWMGGNKINPKSI